METTFQRKVLIGHAMVLAVAIAYCGFLYAGLLLAGLAILFTNLPVYRLLGDEEEESEEEEL